MAIRSILSTLSCAAILSGCTMNTNNANGVIAATDTLTVDSIPYRFHTPLSFKIDKDEKTIWLANSDSSLIEFDMTKKAVVDTCWWNGRFPSDKLNLSVDDGFVRFFDDHSQRLYQMNRSTSKITQWTVQSDSSDLYPIGLPVRVSDKREMTFLEVGFEFSPDNPEAFFSRNLFCTTTLLDSQIVPKQRFGKFPASYQKDFYGEFMPITCETNSGWSYIFSRDPIIYSFNNGKMDSFTINGLPKNRLSPINPDSSTSRLYSLTRELKSDTYVRLIFDKTTKTYLLIQSEGMEINDQSLDLPTFEDKKFNVYIVDSNYNVVARRAFAKIGSYVLIKAAYANGEFYLPRISNQNLTIEKYVFRQNQ